MTPRPTAGTFLDTAIAAAQAAGDHARRQRSRTREVHQHFAHDIKLQLDLECQAKASAVIQARHPHHAILGEEDTDAVAEATGQGAGSDPRQVPPGNGPHYEWVIDPIDGTVNFFHGLPLWCSSVALRINGISVAGVVYAPEMGELYTASAEDVARLNGAPITVSSAAVLADAMLLTGLSQKSEADSTRVAVIEQLSQQVQKVRVLGSAALDMCRVARGHADAYWEPSIHIWDMAASSLVVERAGGRGRILQQTGTVVNFVATNAFLMEAVAGIILAAAPLARDPH